MHFGSLDGGGRGLVRMVRMVRPAFLTEPCCHDHAIMNWITFNIRHMAYHSEPNAGVLLHTCLSLYLELGGISRRSVY